MKPSLKASKRTKERFKQYAPFEILREDDNVLCFPGKSLLLKSLKSKWIGWIPANEIES